MTIDITKLKSARVITDPDEIARRLQKRQDGPTVSIDADGSAQIRKGLPAVRRKADGFPTVDPAKYASLAESVGIEWQEGFEERVVPYWGSDERVDSHGDIVIQNWDFKLFENNPVMPFSHRWEGKPVGNALDWGVADRSGKEYTGPALWLLGLFATGDMNEEAESVFRLVKSGFLRGGSVGFRAGKVIEITNEEERSELGLGRWGVILDENVLLEFSPTTIGANAGAMAVLASAGRDRIIRAGDIQVAREFLRTETHGRDHDADEWARIEAMVIRTARKVFPDADFEPHPELDVPLIGERSDDAGDAGGTSDDRLARIESALIGLEAAQEANETTFRTIRSTMREIQSSLEDFRDTIETGRPDDGDDAVSEALRSLDDSRLDRVLASVGNTKNGS